MSLIAEEEAPGVIAASESLEAGGEAQTAVLGFGDFDVAAKVVGEETPGIAGGGDGLVHGLGEESGLEGGHAEEVELGESDALDGEELLGVGGMVGGDGVLAEVGESVELFETDDGELRGGESVFAGVLGGTGFALGGLGAGGFDGVGPVGGELLSESGFFIRLRGSTGTWGRRGC